MQHLKSVVESVLFKTVPFQAVEQQLYGTGWPVSEVVAGMPCCLIQYPFKQLGSLFVGVFHLIFAQPSQQQWNIHFKTIFFCAPLSAVMDYSK